MNEAHRAISTSAALKLAPRRMRRRPDSEVRLDGNRVVLEEQMMKMTEARADYDAAVTLYTQSLNMMRTAIRKPGG